MRHARRCRLRGGYWSARPCGRLAAPTHPPKEPSDAISHAGRFAETGVTTAQPTTRHPIASRIREYVVSSAGAARQMLAPLALVYSAKRLRARRSAAGETISCAAPTHFIKFIAVQFVYPRGEERGWPCAGIGTFGSIDSYWKIWMGSPNPSYPANDIRTRAFLFLSGAAFVPPWDSQHTSAIAIFICALSLRSDQSCLTCQSRNLDR